MSSLRFANILLETNPRSVCYPSMYCKSDTPVLYDKGTGEWVMYGAGVYDYSTYFNSLSVMKLQRYTSMTSVTLHLELKGAPCVYQQTYGDAFAHVPLRVEDSEVSIPGSDDWQTIEIPIRISGVMVIVGFMLTTEGNVSIRNSYYELDVEDDFNDVELVLATTTFKKEKFIEHNISLVKHEIVESDEEISDHFHMYVIDNGKTLDKQKLDSNRITIVPNDNVGGAGGFTYGMILAMNQRPKATNILLMDDDVAVSPESIKRTYNLLRILKSEYRTAIIAGAMLNYEVGEDQSEDVGFMNEIADCVPVKPPLRLTQYDALVYNETFEPRKKIVNKDNEYAGWWYCCIPIPVIEKIGLPLPVFVRYDDIEYGIRAKSEYITMNSLCVWHQHFASRYNAAVERYQTKRNALIAQAAMGMTPDLDLVWQVKNSVRLELKKFCYDNAELALDGFEDFMKGPRFIAKRGQTRDSFIAANKNKEKTLSLEELQKAADADPDLIGFDIHEISRDRIDTDVPRTLPERIRDFMTDNGQRMFKTEGKGYVVIPLNGWVYPAGVIRGKRKIVAIDWYNRCGVIRTKDTERYHRIRKRLDRDLLYFKANKDRLYKEYAEAAPELTSLGFWKRYLGIDDDSIDAILKNND
ncbi:glycosyltransferase [Bifidobacterium pseudolongum]|uniref:Galactofuranosyltransferase n=1 Tax=Bifidobacterium pseudolongum subsp. globosum TaxID=1690 RepID=A0A4Q5A3E7_9BIFI|nr:glycosyltransferase [Bifidobacterium pseudolongum]RYQ17145.1 galactofuranosyltransferase [Bifidobacterium pseudolongum subsp. globosum]